MRVGEYSHKPPMRRPTTSSQDPSPTPSQPSHSRIEEFAALTALGFGKPLIQRFASRADRHGTSIEAELLADGSIREQAYFAAMARFLRLPFTDRIDAASIAGTDLADMQLLRPSQIRLQHVKKAPQVAIVPEAARLAELSALLDRLPALRQGLVITTPSQIRSAVWTAGAARRAKAAVSDLFETGTQSSARIVLSGAQGFAAGCLVAALMAMMLIAPQACLTALHIAISLLYLGSLMLRLAALSHNQRRTQHKACGRFESTEAADVNELKLPVYTVLVALYREADVVGQLVHALERLDWPRSLLDIKLVCEADDLETIAALEALSLSPHFEIVRVPPCQPRTKPKALTYVLGAARGEFLALYDAEDRPHPQQLKEAYRRFRSGSQMLACLQAPLVITNAQQSFFSALFALEYSALFRGLLPMLAAYRLPLPLGGTSNHFRTSVLREIGGWDPFNVTEDADLGIRLYRHGYHAGTLHRQTLEDAPTSLSIWFGQRTRWYKGWIQTWLVTMRHPALHLREMGLRGAFAFHLMIGGMLVSALLHPLLFILLGKGVHTLLTDPAPGIALLRNPLLFIDAVNIVGSYVLLVRLGLCSMTEHERRLVGRRWMAMPVYWLMTSLAAWIGANELRTKPFFWNKTPHRPVDATIGTKK